MKNKKAKKTNNLLVISDLFADGPQQAPAKIAISQTGLYTPAFGDPREITEEMFDKMISNFEANILKTKLSVYYSHWDSKRTAAGEITDVYKSYNENLSKTVLYANIEWTPQGKRAILEKEYKYVSAEFAYDYRRATDKEGSFQSYGAVLLGVALTNEPAVYDIPQIVFSGNKKFVAQFANLGSNKNDDDKPLKGDLKMDKLLKAMNVKTEDEALEAYSHLVGRIDHLEKSDFSKQLKEKDSAIDLLKDEITKMKDEKFSTEKKSFLDGLFEAGKITKEKYDKANNYTAEQFSVFKEISSDLPDVLPKTKGTPKQKGAKEKPEMDFNEFAEKFDPAKSDEGVR